MNNKTKCFICKKNKLITEEHYIVPIAEATKINKARYEDEIINLCPNCHTYLHLILNNKFEKFENIFEYFKSKQARDALLKLYGRYYYLRAKNER